MANIKEADFNLMCDIMDELDDVTEGYFPTVEELSSHNVEENIQEFLPILTYFASDPFKRQGLPDVDNEEYKGTVSYCKRLLYNLDFADEQN